MSRSARGLPADVLAVRPELPRPVAPNDDLWYTMAFTSKNGTVQLR